jgi:hypothetical protein
LTYFKIDAADIDRIAEKTLLSYGKDTGSKHPKFWILLTLAGVIAIAYLFSMVEPLGLFTEGNSQVLSRVQPRLIDLIAALATGRVGAFSLVRYLD